MYSCARRSSSSRSMRPGWPMSRASRYVGEAVIVPPSAVLAVLLGALHTGTGRNLVPQTVGLRADQCVELGRDGRECIAVVHLIPFVR